MIIRNLVASAGVLLARSANLILLVDNFNAKLILKR